MKTPATELIPRVSQFCLKEWQDIWDWCEPVRVTSYMLFTQTLVEFHTVKTCLGTMQLLLIDYELVILALRTCTCLQAKICQHVSFAVFHSLLITYFWNVPI